MVQDRFGRGHRAPGSQRGSFQQRVPQVGPDYILLGPVFRIRIDFGRLDPDPRWQILRAEAEGFSCSLDAFMEAQVSGSGSGSRRAKMTHKIVQSSEIS
jgi:hypothetical protein